MSTTTHFGTVWIQFPLLSQNTGRYLGGTEVFRTSTEEPRQQGISYTYMKDMSQYMALWKQPQKVIFDLPNLLNANASTPPHHRPSQKNP